MPNVGPMELIVILAIALIVLGPKKLPEVGKSLGKGMREFKESLSGENERRDDDERPAIKSELPARASRVGPRGPTDTLGAWTSPPSSSTASSPTPGAISPTNAAA